MKKLVPIVGVVAFLLGCNRENSSSGGGGRNATPATSEYGSGQNGQAGQSSGGGSSGPELTGDKVGTGNRTNGNSSSAPVK